jgi:hypothetical protein
MDDSPVQPTRQEVVPLFDSFVVAVSLPDGRIGATLTSLCDALGLTQPSQSRRIRADEVLSHELVSVGIQTSNGVQTLAVLTAWAIPLWLTGIHVTRLAEPKRAAILAFKREAADTLYRHFSQPRLTTPAVPATKPVAPSDDAPRDEWRAFYAAMVQWLDWQSEIDVWRSETDHRLDEMQSEIESMHELTRVIPDILERLGPVTLSPEHLASVQAMAKRLHEVGGFAYSTIYAELNQAFHVGKYDQIPDEAWHEVTAWFTTRTNAAERRDHYN